MTDNESDDYGLLMPFVVCQSQGGPLEDVAFTIGFELGGIDAELDVCRTVQASPHGRYVHEAGIKQLDLIAMRRGFTIETAEHAGVSEWLWVQFKRQESDE